jgi:MSHA biogenesis protein MshI
VLEFLKRRGKREPGWLAISLQPDRMHFAHATRAAGRHVLTRHGSQPIGTEKEFQRTLKEFGFDRYDCLTVLPSSDYQLLLVDGPDVPAAELKNAARWKIKDMIDYPVGEATVDVLQIHDPRSGTRTQPIYTVAARNEVIRNCMERFSKLHLRLSVIDIIETAQRNIAALLEPPGGGVALLYIDRDHVLCTVNFEGELYLSRRFDIGLEELEKLAEGSSDEAKNRILLEVQRSFDHLERQFPFVHVAKLLVAPTPADTGLQSYLAENLDVAVEEVRLDELLDRAPGVELDRESAWRLFHLIGASLRGQPVAA